MNDADRLQGESKYESPEMPAATFFDDPREAALIRAVARHRAIAPLMYRGIGLTAKEQQAMEAVVNPLLSEIERLQGLCLELSRKLSNERNAQLKVWSAYHSKRFFGWLQTKLNIMRK